MPSSDVGADVRMNRVLNCWPWLRSLTHSPVAVTHSPAEMVAAWPTTVTRSRWPRALIRMTQKPFSELWNVTRSTRPASTSLAEEAETFVCCFTVCMGAWDRPPLAEQGRHVDRPIRPATLRRFTP